MAEIVIVSLGALLLLQEIWTHRSLCRVLREPRPRPPKPTRSPLLSMIRPIRGLDVEAEENLRNALELSRSWPGAMQTIFVFDDPSEPAAAILERLLAERPSGARNDDIEVLYCGAPPACTSGKLNAMITGWTRASGELVAFADSDIRVDPEAVEELISILVPNPKVGCAFPSAIPSEASRTMGDSICALLLNGLHHPAAMRVAHRTQGRLPFILGQLMIFNRRAIDAIGGLEGARGQLTDDLYLGRLVEQHGFSNVLSSGSVRIIQYGLSAPDAIAQAVRWMAFSRTGIQSWSFKGPIVWRVTRVWLGLVGVVVAATSGLLGASLLFAASVVVGCFSMGRLHERIGGAPLRGRHRLAPLLLCLLAPYAFGRAYLGRRIDWRGRAYVLSRGARLETGARH